MGWLVISVGYHKSFKGDAWVLQEVFEAVLAKNNCLQNPGST